MKLLSNWAAKLKTNTHLEQEEFPIAELNNVAQQLKDSLKHITEYNQREQQFLKYASHEIRTPLATIQACLDTLDIQLQGSTNKTVKRAIRASDTINRLSTSLLWLARGSDTKVNSSIIDLALFCNRQIDAHKYLHSKRNIEFKLVFNSNFIEIEEDLFMVVFANLLRNACQNTESGIITIIFNSDSFSISNPIDSIALDSSKVGNSFGIGLELVMRICKKLEWTFTYKEVDGHVVVEINLIER